MSSGRPASRLRWDLSNWRREDPSSWGPSLQSQRSLGQLARAGAKSDTSYLQIALWVHWVASFDCESASVFGIHLREMGHSKKLESTFHYPVNLNQTSCGSPEWLSSTGSLSNWWKTCALPKAPGRMKLCSARTTSTCSDLPGFAIGFCRGTGACCPAQFGQFSNFVTHEVAQ